MKLVEAVGLRTRNNRLHFGIDPDLDLDPGPIFPL